MDNSGWIDRDELMKLGEGRRKMGQVEHAKGEGDGEGRVRVG